jgi:hypothetical protein
VVDAGDGTASLPADQRGVARPAGAEVDMGAVELGEGVVQFAVTNVVVNEEDGVVTLTVSRTGGFDGAASVDYDTADGTAVSPADYLAEAGTLCWSDGDDEPKTFDVAIVDDLVPDAGETFTVVLSNATDSDAACGGGALVARVPAAPRRVFAAAELGPSSTAQVTILEGGAEPAAIPTAGEYARLLLAALLAGAGAWMARRRSATARLTVRRR